MDQILLHDPWKETTLSTPWSQTSGLQNCEIIHFCGLGCPVSGTLSRQSQQTNTAPLPTAEACCPRGHGFRGCFPILKWETWEAQLYSRCSAEA